MKYILWPHRKLNGETVQNVPPHEKGIFPHTVELFMEPVQCDYPRCKWIQTIAMFATPLIVSLCFSRRKLSFFWIRLLYQFYKPFATLDRRTHRDEISASCAGIVACLVFSTVSCDFMKPGALYILSPFVAYRIFHVADKKYISHGFDVQRGKKNLHNVCTSLVHSANLVCSVIHSRHSASYIWLHRMSSTESFLTTQVVNSSVHVIFFKEYVLKILPIKVRVVD